MAKSAKTTELEDTIRDIYDTVQEAGSTRADMEISLDAIADLCTEAIPDLDGENSEEDQSDSDSE